MTASSSQVTARQLTRHITRGSKRLAAAATPLADARDEIAAAVELLRGSGYDPAEIANCVTGECFRLTAIASDLAGDEEYLGRAEEIARLAEVVASLAETLTEFSSAGLARAGEPLFADGQRRAEVIEVGQRSQ